MAEGTQAAKEERLHQSRKGPIKRKGNNLQHQIQELIFHHEGNKRTYSQVLQKTCRSLPQQPCVDRLQTPKGKGDSRPRRYQRCRRRAGRHFALPSSSLFFPFHLNVLTSTAHKQQSLNCRISLLIFYMPANT
ncbi:hypothetical protein, unlikely [Trypanosoma congolense IL3000]|uniref:Uncharacterized protein n=1 Tax=Trypanosoma congolense (strain IL3000) TaxID=1068625 RepID=F9WCS3_TRYCI|nr:hypothetical protein, unlikely [Trypanosoma congolense IL3000]